MKFKMSIHLLLKPLFGLNGPSPLNSVRIRVQDKCEKSSFIFDVAMLRPNVIHLAIPNAIIVGVIINVEYNQSQHHRLLSFQIQVATALTITNFLQIETKF